MKINVHFVRKKNYQDYNKAGKMNIDEKCEGAKKTDCCFLCIKRSHVDKKCHSKTKCFLCDKFHCRIVYPNSPLESKIETLKHTENMSI